MSSPQFSLVALYLVTWYKQKKLVPELVIPSHTSDSSLKLLIDFYSGMKRNSGIKCKPVRFQSTTETLFWFCVQQSCGNWCETIFFVVVLWSKSYSETDFWNCVFCFCFVLFFFFGTVSTQYWKLFLPWNPRAQNGIDCLLHIPFLVWTISLQNKTHTTIGLCKQGISFHHSCSGMKISPLCRHSPRKPFL